MSAPATSLPIAGLPFQQQILFRLTVQKAPAVAWEKSERALK